jgi:hypothetical protein
VTVRSQPSAGWMVFRKCAHTRPRTRYAVGTAIITTLSYLTVMLACACTDGKYLRSSGVQNPARATVTAEDPGPDTDEELCRFVHEQMLTLQASSTRSILVTKTSSKDVLIDEEVPRQTPILIAFRPPGDRFAPAKILGFRLYSVLRI